MAEGRPEAYITGIGVVTPVGVGRKKLWSSLLANESGAGPITLFDPERFDVRIAAECTDFDPESFMDRKVAARTDRFAQMGLRPPSSPSKMPARGTYSTRTRSGSA